LGKGCAMALAGEGVELVINARTKSSSRRRRRRSARSTA
jgi:hypothetical protein